jgi:hypothetical protein
MNLEFIFDIIKSHAKGYHYELRDAQISDEEYHIRINTLATLQVALANFIKEAKELTEKK